MSNEAKKIETVFPKEAAALAMEKLLENKVKGDHITAREILDGTGFTAKSMSRRLYTWAKRKRFKIRAVIGDGYRILLDTEIADEARARTEAENRHLKETARIVLQVDHTKLDEQQSRRIEWLAPRVAHRAAQVDRDVKDTRQEFRLTERVPLRALAKPKE